MIAIVPAIIISLIDGLGEWLNHSDYKQSKALEAVRSFRNHVENRTNTPSTDYSKNISGLSDNQILQLVIFLNQWSVYVIDSVASKRILINLAK